LLSSFFSPILNNRSDRFGGDTARRAERPLARQFRTALAMPLMLLGGINRLDTVEDALDEGSQLVACAAPRSVPGQEVSRGVATEGLCTHCMKCMPTV
jgi:2,4-dienoyl-CoA reductase-like NADH-dependent reductase (Old Yellow Enzyme family)